MAFDSDWLANIFLFTLLFGLVFAIVSVFLGGFHVGSAVHGHHIHLHLGGHHVGAPTGAHTGGHHGGLAHHAHAHSHASGNRTSLGHHADIHAGGHGGVHADATGADGPGVLNMPTIMAFLTWFGGAGYLLMRSIGVAGFFAVPLALMSGLMGGSIMYTLLNRLLWPMVSKPMNKADYYLPGTAARITSPIREGGVGEIVYTKAGSRFTAGARSADGAPIAKGTEVVILGYERGLASVQAVDTLLGQRENDI